MKNVNVKLNSGIIASVVEGKCKFMEQYLHKPTDIFMVESTYYKLCLECSEMSDMKRSNMAVSEFDGMSVHQTDREVILGDDVIVFKGPLDDRSIVYFRWKWLAKVSNEEYKKKFLEIKTNKRMLRPID